MLVSQSIGPLWHSLMLQHEIVWTDLFIHLSLPWLGKWCRIWLSSLCFALADYCCWFQLPLSQTKKMDCFLPSTNSITALVGGYQIHSWYFIASKKENNPKMFVIPTGCNIILTHFCMWWGVGGRKAKGDEALCRCCVSLLMQRNRWVASVRLGLYS